MWCAPVYVTACMIIAPSHFEVCRYILIFQPSTGEHAVCFAFSCLNNAALTGYIGKRVLNHSYSSLWLFKSFFLTGLEISEGKDSDFSYGNPQISAEAQKVGVE